MNEKITSIKKGSVLIVGGGIGGMQAALDLADSGFKVHMVQRDPSIRGTMVMLDKTFPTGDCSMCMISPKMVEVGRHLNIDIPSLAEVMSVEGKPGDFKVKIKIAPRYVDPDKCTGCGDCEAKCPKRVSSEFEQGLISRKAIYVTSKWLPQMLLAFLAQGLAASSQKVLVESKAGDFVWQFYIILYWSGFIVMSLLSVLRETWRNRREFATALVRAVCSVVGNVSITTAMNSVKVADRLMIVQDETKAKRGDHGELHNPANIGRVSRGGRVTKGVRFRVVYRHNR